MITVEIDGVYCKRCNDMHPTLCWHEKYDELLDFKSHIETYKRASERFKISFTDAKLEELYKDKLRRRGVKIEEKPGCCSVCSCETKFINIESNAYVCSDECKYKGGIV